MDDEWDIPKQKDHYLFGGGDANEAISIIWSRANQAVCRTRDEKVSLYVKVSILTWEVGHENPVDREKASYCNKYNISAVANRDEIFFCLVSLIIQKRQDSNCQQPKKRKKKTDWPLWFKLFPHWDGLKVRARSFFLQSHILEVVSIKPLLQCGE